MAQDNYARLVGMSLELDGDDGPYRTCPHCGSCNGKVAEGAGPHILSTICTGCDRHIAWISKRAARALDARRAA